MQLDVFDIHAFEADPTEFHLVCTDIKTGQPVYRQINHVEDQTLEWFRATGSMPIVSTPVEIDGMRLLDGGMVDCIPLRHFQTIGYDRNIVLLTRPKGYQKTPNKMAFLFQLFYPRYPKVAECMKRRHEMYNAQLAYLQQEEQAGRILLIYPEEALPIGRTEQDEQKIRRVYKTGRLAAEQRLGEIEAFLNFDLRPSLLSLGIAETSFALLSLNRSLEL
jgi:predicted patatin/cPLA2 family phospholipase